MTRLSPVLTTADLPYAELCAARLDGDVYALDSCFVPIDQPDLPSLRAETIAVRWPERLIAEQRSAAWVHGALLRPPARHELCADIAARARPSNTRHARIREVVIEPAEIVRIGPLEVTTPLRTAIDLARFSAQFDELERGVCAALMTIGDFGPDDCRASMDARRNLPNKRLALERLERVWLWSAGAHAIHVVDGVDAAHGVEHTVEVRGVTHLEHVPTEREALARC